MLSQHTSHLHHHLRFSRIIKVRGNNHVEWVSEAIPGAMSGKVVTTQGIVNPGTYIFFTHNQNVTSEVPIGTFSMVLGETGDLLFSEISGTSALDPNIADVTLLETWDLPYGPVGVEHNPVLGRYPGGEGNTNDLFVWSTSAGDGTRPTGYTRAFQLPRLFQPEFARK